MSALRIIGSGLGCATFAALGAFVGSEVGRKVNLGPDGLVGSAVAGSALGALLTGVLAGAGSEHDCQNRASGLAGAGPDKRTLRFP
jgi:hypothetical protein